MKVLKTYFIYFVVTLEATSAQFLEQPNPGILFAPVEYEVTLTCTVEEGYLIDWHVLLPNGIEVDASSRIARQVLMEQGFTLEGVVTTRSTLSLRETEDEINNGTNITCLAQETGAQGALVIGNVIQVIFYAGAPPPPTNPSVTEDGQGTFNITWSLMVIEGASVNYTLTVFNLNTTSAQPIIIAGLLDQHYVFETSRPCDVYSFTVTAVTAAGNSSPSQELIFTKNGNSAICFATTSEIFSTMHSTASTTFSLPTTQTEFSQPLTTSTLSTQDNSTVILITAVSIAFAVLMTVLVLVNVMICVFCYKKNKTELKPDMKDPVYEAPGDIPMLPFSIKDRGTPFAMTSSSAYEATENSQKLPFKASSPKSSKNDTESSYVPFAMKSSSAYEISKNSHGLPLEVCQNLSPSNSSKNLEAEDGYIPFAMTSSAAYELSKHPQNLDTQLTNNESTRSADSASDTVPFAMTSSLAYEVSKHLDSDHKIISTASPSADESSKKLDSEIALPSADKFSSKLDIEGSTGSVSSANKVSLTPQKHPPDNSSSPSFSTYEFAMSPDIDEPAKSLDTDNNRAHYVL